MRNLYVETIEALFFSDIKPWNIESVTMVDNTCMSIIELTWDEFTDLAKKVNYKPNVSATVIAESLSSFSISLIIFSKLLKVIRLSI